MAILQNHELPAKLDAWLSALKVNRTKSLRLRTPALLVVDMQKDFLLPSGLLKVWGGPAVIPNIRRLIKAFHAAKAPVFFSRHIYENPERDGGATARWWNVDRNSMLLREGTWHTELHDAIVPGRNDKVIPKRRYSAFFGTDLELLLRTAGICDVVITGVCTNICCQATAYDAFFRDFNVFFVIDATGATDEAAHLATLQNIALSYGKPVIANQVIDAVKRLGRPNRPKRNK